MKQRIIISSLVAMLLLTSIFNAETVNRPTYIRSVPSTINFKKLDSLYAGDEISVIEQLPEMTYGTYWALVEHNGITGYIPSSYIDTEVVASENDTPSETEDTSEKEILFRGIPWGLDYNTVNSAYFENCLIPVQSLGTTAITLNDIVSNNLITNS